VAPRPSPGHDSPRGAVAPPPAGRRLLRNLLDSCRLSPASRLRPLTGREGPREPRGRGGASRRRAALRGGPDERGRRFGGRAGDAREAQGGRARALDCRLETAQQEAEARLAATRREAARLRAQAEADLREELASLPEEVAAGPQDSRPRGWQVSLRLPHPD
jgi:hypothetical protein